MPRTKSKAVNDRAMYPIPTEKSGANKELKKYCKKEHGKCIQKDGNKRNSPGCRKDKEGLLCIEVEPITRKKNTTTTRTGSSQMDIEQEYNEWFHTNILKEQSDVDEIYSGMKDAGMKCGKSSKSPNPNECVLMNRDKTGPTCNEGDCSILLHGKIRPTTNKKNNIKNTPPSQQQQRVKNSNENQNINKQPRRRMPTCYPWDGCIINKDVSNLPGWKLCEVTEEDPDGKLVTDFLSVLIVAYALVETNTGYSDLLSQIAIQKKPILNANNDKATSLRSTIQRNCVKSYQSIADIINQHYDTTKITSDFIKNVKEIDRWELFEYIVGLLKDPEGYTPKCILLEANENSTIVSTHHVSSINEGNNINPIPYIFFRNSTEKMFILVNYTVENNTTILPDWSGDDASIARDDDDDDTHSDTNSDENQNTVKNKKTIPPENKQTKRPICQPGNRCIINKDVSTLPGWKLCEIIELYEGKPVTDFISAYMALFLHMTFPVFWSQLVRQQFPVITINPNFSRQHRGLFQDYCAKNSVEIINTIKRRYKRTKLTSDLIKTVKVIDKWELFDYWMHSTRHKLTRSPIRVLLKVGENNTTVLTHQITTMEDKPNHKKEEEDFPYIFVQKRNKIFVLVPIMNSAVTESDNESGDEDEDRSVLPIISARRRSSSLEEGLTEARRSSSGGENRHNQDEDVIISAGGGGGSGGGTPFQIKKKKFNEINNREFSDIKQKNQEMERYGMHCGKVFATPPAPDGTYTCEMKSLNKHAVGCSYNKSNSTCIDTKKGTKKKKK
jgi:hypothetical protein